MEISAGRLPAPLERALAERGYRELTPVQRAVLADAARGRDLLVSAPTGSGKTVAFGLALAEHLAEPEDGSAPGAPRALVIAPTRELARQVAGELGWLLGGVGARVGCCTGGADPRAERAALARGVDVVVGSAGRLRDHAARRALIVDAVLCVVLDEADEMLGRGFREDIEFILAAVPSGRRTLMFSATLTSGIERRAAGYQRDALRLDLARRQWPAIEGVVVAEGQREAVVAGLLRWHDAAAALVFCGRREAAARLEHDLARRGFSTVGLSGALGQRERDAAMAALAGGRARVCVATDVAARGLDLPGLDLVIHADLPGNAEMLLHRSGRCGRSGRMGAVALLAAPEERRRAARLAAQAGLTLGWAAPASADALRRRELERLMTVPDLAAPLARDEGAAAAELLAARGPEAIAAAFVHLWLAARPG